MRAGFYTIDRHSLSATEVTAPSGGAESCIAQAYVHPDDLPGIGATMTVTVIVYHASGHNRASTWKVRSGGTIADLLVQPATQNGTVQATLSAPAATNYKLTATITRPTVPTLYKLTASVPSGAANNIFTATWIFSQ